MKEIRISDGDWILYYNPDVSSYPVINMALSINMLNRARDRAFGIQEARDEYHDSSQARRSRLMLMFVLIKLGVYKQ